MHNSPLEYVTAIIVIKRLIFIIYMTSTTLYIVNVISLLLVCNNFLKLFISRNVFERQLTYPYKLRSCVLITTYKHINSTTCSQFPAE